MALPIKALIIDTSMAALEQLDESCRPEIEFEYLDVVQSVHKAIQYHMEMDFQLCFISDTFPIAEVHSFFKDYKKLGKTNNCVFLQIRDNVHSEFRRESLSSIGFQSVISKSGTEEDKRILSTVLKPFEEAMEYASVIEELPQVVENIMKEIDRVANEKKRGKDKSLSTIYSDHLRTSMEKFGKVKEGYIDQLVDSVEEAKPFTDEEIVIPDEITKKNLPHLTKTNYLGQSHRVFAKLLKLHSTNKGSKKS